MTTRSLPIFETRLRFIPGSETASCSRASVKQGPVIRGLSVLKSEEIPEMNYRAGSRARASPMPVGGLLASEQDRFFELFVQRVEPIASL